MLKPELRKLAVRTQNQLMLKSEFNFCWENTITSIHTYIHTYVIGHYSPSVRIIDHYKLIANNTSVS